MAPLYHALRATAELDVRLVHTGQHYDQNLSDTFFADLNLPAPDKYLDVGRASHAVQTARIMEGYERLCLDVAEPDLVIAVGDVNSTLACALTAKKRNLTVVRSGDRSMPEEINRIVADAISDYLWTHSPDADENLSKEGRPACRVRRVGNIMIDAYEMVATKIEQVDAAKKYGIIGDFILTTIHRPSNVDLAENVQLLVEQLLPCEKEWQIVFSVHPRTRQRLEMQGLWPRFAAGAVKAIDPIGYIEFISLVKSFCLVVTDSGGLQEETTYLGIPCITVRETTERPITITSGTNRLACIEQLAASVYERLREPQRRRLLIALWDGRTAGRIVGSLRGSFFARQL